MHNVDNTVQQHGTPRLYQTNVQHSKDERWIGGKNTTVILKSHRQNIDMMTQIELN